MTKQISYGDLPRIMREHPLGLFVAILLLALLLIYGGVFGCLFKILIRFPFNLQTPDRILAGDICNPDKMFRVKLGEWIINLFMYEWFVYTVLIIGVIIFVYFRINRK